MRRLIPRGYLVSSTVNASSTPASVRLVSAVKGTTVDSPCCSSGPLATVLGWPAAGMTSYQSL
jgi:hypothetical protein